MTESLLGSYIMRVAIYHHRWHLTLQDVRSGETQTFSSFQDLLEHVEAETTRLHDSRLAASKHYRP